jgi:hypothetical protein
VGENPEKPKIEDFEKYNEQRELLLRNWTFINESIYSTVSQLDKDKKEQSNAHLDSRRKVSKELPTDCYVMVRKGFGDAIQGDKLAARFFGPFRAKKDNNSYDLYDKKDKFYKRCPPQELKFIKIMDESLLIDLESNKIIDETINAATTRSRRDIDYHPNIEAFNYLDEDDEIEERSTEQVRKSELKLRKRKKAKRKVPKKKTD